LLFFRESAIVRIFNDAISKGSKENATRSKDKNCPHDTNPIEFFERDDRESEHDLSTLEKALKKIHRRKNYRDKKRDCANTPAESMTSEKVARNITGD
jgi:hypothetical protein